MQGVRAISQAVEHLECGLVGLGAVGQESRVVRRPVGSVDVDLRKRLLIGHLERLECELLDVDGLRELHGDLRGGLIEDLSAGRRGRQDCRRSRSRLDEEIQDVRAGAPAQLGTVALVGIEEAGTSGHLALHRGGCVGGVGHGEVVVSGRQADGQFRVGEQGEPTRRYPAWG